MTKGNMTELVSPGQQKLLQVLERNALEAVYGRNGWRLVRLPSGFKRADFDAVLKSGKARITGAGMLEAIKTI